MTPCSCPTHEQTLHACLADMRAAVAERYYVMRWYSIPALGLAAAAVAALRETT